MQSRVEHWFLLVSMGLIRMAAGLWILGLQICRPRGGQLAERLPQVRGSLLSPKPCGAGRPRDFARIWAFQTGLTVLTRLTAWPGAVDRECITIGDRQ